MVRLYACYTYGGGTGEEPPRIVRSTSCENGWKIKCTWPPTSLSVWVSDTFRVNVIVWR